MKLYRSLPTGLILLNIYSSVAQADYVGKSFSDEEIKKLILQRTLTQFANQECYLKTLVPPAPPTPEGNTRTRTDKLTYGNLGFYRPRLNYEWDYQRQKTDPQRPEPIYKCLCPCPESRNYNGEPCGENSAYFLYPNEFKPKCYPEDIQKWEVDDFRSAYEISIPPPKSSSLPSE